ncbi:MAG: SAP domain-containing protein [Clostridia bacterium]|nr:SAP domain-containing protein [Clostridia bacterium]
MRQMKDYEEFSSRYRYRSELVQLCKRLGIDHSGNKADLLDNIKAYYDGIVVKPDKKKIAKATDSIQELSPDVPLLKCGFKFSNRFRQYFSQLSGVANFKFNADMVAAWRKVKSTGDMSYTLADMLEVYYRKSDYTRYDNSECKWNKFVKDFCADCRNAPFDNKLKVASILWGIVRESTMPKVYSYQLVEDNMALIDRYRR